MLSNYLKIAFRNLRKNKIYSVINILGLATGLACCILIALFVNHELSFDRFYENSDRIHRVALDRLYPEHTTSYAVIPGGFSEVFQRELAEVAHSTRLVGLGNFSQVISYGDVAYEETRVFFADSNFFDVFDFELIRGDASALSRPRTFILTESTARKYFGEEDPVGKTLEVDGNPVEVTGVMQDIPANSHIAFDFLGSTVNVPFLRQPSYTAFSSYTYLELEEGVTPQQVEAKIPELVTRYASGQIERNLGVSYEDYTAAGNGYHYFLQPISDIHLRSNLEAEIKPNGNITYIYIFISISVFILLIACINFVNMATARSAERAKEVGLRKVMGSDRMQLVRQFLTESTFITLLSLVIALGIVQAVLPIFNNLTGLQLTADLFGSGLLTILVGTAILVGLAAGIYPALHISSLKPVEVMKGKFRSSRQGQWLRNGLVVLQFSIAIILISGTIVVYNQMQFIQERDLGYSTDNIVVIERPNSVDGLSAFKEHLRNQPEILNATGSSSMPGGRTFGISFRPLEGGDATAAKAISIDDRFLETMGINMMAGRGFSEEFNDSLSVILNQSAVSALGLDNPIGARLSSTNTVNNEQATSTFTVIGIVEDFNFESLHTPITPLALVSTEGFAPFQTALAVRFSGSDYAGVVQRLEESWKSFAPDQPFLYSFLNSNLESLYRSEQTSANVLSLFSILAILISCVGLFGLAAYMTFQRTKEIGVRKVLGAKVSGIVFLLSKDFALLVGVAFVISAPVAYLLMSEWLESFAFRVDLTPLMFLAAGLFALAIALLTVSYQAISAAVANPVNSLRNE